MLIHEIFLTFLKDKIMTDMFHVKNVRNLMAEKGYEITPDVMSYVLKQISIIQNGIDKDREFYKDLCNLDLAGKQKLRNLFAETGKEVLMSEIDDIIFVLDKLIK